MKNLKDMATKQVLLELRKKINRLIADSQVEDPEAMAEGETEDEEAVESVDGDMEDESYGSTATGSEDLASVEPEEDELRSTMRDYFNPKPREKRPGTAMMIAVEQKKPNKGRFGKLPRKEMA